MVSQEPQELPMRDTFYRYFQMEVTALLNQISKLETLPVVGGERLDAMDHCLAGIARLQKEVQDASPNTPAYDQELYADGLKALKDKFDETRAALQPKPKFAFKNSIKKNGSAISLTDAAELASQQKARLFQDSKDLPSSDDGTHEASESWIPSHKGVHLVQPTLSSQSWSHGIVKDLDRCILDVSMAPDGSQSLAALTLNKIRNSLLICGTVNGAIRVASVTQSVIVVAAKQFRMYGCEACTVYLHTNGQPIIEDCRNISFAPLPERFAPRHENLTNVENQWNHVQDFNHLKDEQSPNWSMLPSNQRLRLEQWAKATQPMTDRPRDAVSACMKLVSSCRRRLASDFKHCMAPEGMASDGVKETYRDCYTFTHVCIDDAIKGTLRRGSTV